MQTADLVAFHGLGQHDYHADVLLPNHSPEVDDSVLQTSLSCYVSADVVTQLANTITAPTLCYAFITLANVGANFENSSTFGFSKKFAVKLL